MKTLMARLMGITLVIAPTYSNAQICESEVQQVMKVRKENNETITREKVLLIAKAVVLANTKSACQHKGGDHVIEPRPDLRTVEYYRSRIQTVTEKVVQHAGKSRQLGYKIDLAGLKLQLCIAQNAPIRGTCSGSALILGAGPTSHTSKSAISTPTPTNAKLPARPSSSKQSNAEYGASKCLSLIKEKTLYGGFINSCPFKVQYGYCVEEPKKGAWSESVDCSKVKGGGGGQVIRAKGKDGQHTKGGKKVHWTACMYEDRNGKFLNVGPWDVAWDNQKKKLNSWCGHR